MEPPDPPLSLGGPRRAPTFAGSGGEDPGGGSESAEAGRKPSSVVGDHFSGTPLARGLQRPTRESWRAGPAHPPLFGLSPGGVCRAVPVTRDAVRSYRTFSPLPRKDLRPSGAVCFLWHFPWDRSRFPLGTTLPCGARTFLAAAGQARHPRRGRLADFRNIYYITCSAHDLGSEDLSVGLLANRISWMIRRPAA